MGKLSGKVAVITGANSGMGLATAKRFVEEGAWVFITGRRQKELEAAAKEVGKNVTAVQGDIAELADLDRLFDTVKRDKGHIDILFANAGIARMAPMTMVDESFFEQQFNTNVRGTYFTIQKALPLLKDGGSIILNSSVANQGGMAGMSVYSATKAAVRSFARTMTSELKDRNIRVNTISPGPIETPIFGKLGLTEEQMKGMGSHMLSQIPMGRMGRPEEIANAALFFASDESSFVTGVELCVDGGLSQV